MGIDIFEVVLARAFNRELLTLTFAAIGGDRDMQFVAQIGAVCDEVPLPNSAGAP